ncbi:MAG: dihydroorotase [Thermoguttaceae bacterium]|nr:dihydroorotase [Thermoguttaceae bacterium]
MKDLFLENARVIDPAAGLDRKANILIRAGKIAAVDPAEAPADAERLDLSGRIAAPGLIDLHVHLRQPGGEEDETIESGTLAAVAGGFTSIACCPNTQPPLDTQASVELVRQLALRARHCRVYPLCCISKNREGNELAELGVLFAAGAAGCTDDGAPVADAELMRRAMEYTLMFDKPVLSHAESLPLDKGGVMHEGLVSLELGLRGMPAAAEDIMVSRDIHLAEITGARLHVMHVSTAGAVAAIRRAKERGVKLSAEVTPHHLTLTDESLRSFDSNFKMNPPLRSARHVEACIEGLRDGTIDAIATDHAPHAREKKIRAINVAPFGIIGLETALPLMIEKFIDSGLLTWPQLIEKMSLNPSRILGIGKGTLAVGADADVTVIDPEAEWTLTEETIHSKSCNTPWLGRSFKGRAVMTIVEGEVRYKI